MPEYSMILVDTSGGVTTITLNRPDSFNALTGAMADEVCVALEEARTTDRVGAVVITGAGRAFCSGQDLKSMEDEGSGGDIGDFVRSHLRLHFNRMILAVRTLPKPVVGSINGVAAGAGMSLALACDLRVGTDKSSFMQAFARVGLLPDAGSTYLLPALVGTARALDLAWTARRLGADEALSMGLLNRKVPEGDLAAETRELAESLARGPSLATALAKEAIYGSAERGLAAALELEADLQAQCIATDDFQEGVTAFLEKREPRFGRSPARS
ncbi:MAG TPA: enoyl-CoA hydratase-related protein [Candidatus Dormibacteraeota bacterium]|nr:enoyl-CoA hydratase-related protein [Candidatus Dormibacteraeota bacterium]